MTETNEAKQLNKKYFNLIDKFKHQFYVIKDLKKQNTFFNFKDLIYDFESDCELMIDKWFGILYALYSLKNFKLYNTLDIKNKEFSMDYFYKYNEDIFYFKSKILQYRIKNNTYFIIKVIHEKYPEKHGLILNLCYEEVGQEIVLYRREELVKYLDFKGLKLVLSCFYTDIESFLLRNR